MLIVEDDATVRLILADVLEELGYNVLLASDARPAAVPGVGKEGDARQSAGLP